MTEVEVKALLDEILNLEKANPSPKMPPYRPAYVDSIEQRDAIKIHADPKVFPEKLFKNRAPNQDLEQKKYVRDNYKNTTSQVFNDYLTTIGRAFIDSNWQLIPREGSDELMEYLSNDLPKYGSVETFIKGILPSIKTQDANGVLAVMPHGFEMVDRDGELVLNDQARFEPTIFYYPSERVLKFEAGKMALCVSAEKSIVEYGGKMIKEGRIMFLYTPETIWKIEQIGKKVDNSYAISEYFAHGEDVLPAIQLKGIPIITPDGSIYWVSPFYYAVALLDLALTNRNYLQLSIANSAFPFRIMKGTRCEFKDDEHICRDGHLISALDGYDKGLCRSCKGTGVNAPVSPMGTLFWTDKDRFDPNGNASSYPLVEYVEPSTANMEFVRKQVEIDTNEARTTIHLQPVTPDVTAPDRTATGEIINQQGQFLLVKDVSEQMFDAFDFINHRIAFQRYDNADLAPTLVYPQTFDFRTEADIWAQIKAAREADAPPFIIHTLFVQLIHNMLSSDIDAQAVLELMSNADRLFSLSATEIAMRKASNSIEPWQVTLHDSGVQLVAELIEADQSFLNKEMPEKIAALVDAAKNATFTPQTNLIDSILNG
jgi:hypothetical protein